MACCQGLSLGQGTRVCPEEWVQVSLRAFWPQKLDYQAESAVSQKPGHKGLCFITLGSDSRNASPTWRAVLYCTQVYSSGKHLAGTLCLVEAPTFENSDEGKEWLLWGGRVHPEVSVFLSPGAKKLQTIYLAAALWADLSASLYWSPIYWNIGKELHTHLRTQLSRTQAHAAW